MTTLRERINAALDANGLQHWVIGTNPMRNHELAEACRDLLPLVLAEMEKLEEEAKYAPRLRVELRDTERELIAMTAEWNEARTLLAECRAQNRAMAETMSGLKSEREHIAAMTAERDAMRSDLELCREALDAIAFKRTDSGERARVCLTRLTAPKPEGK